MAAAAEEVRPLRGAVLRPGLPLAAAVWPGDDDPAALHLAAYAGQRRGGVAPGEPVGVVTLIPAGYPGPSGDPPPPAGHAGGPPAGELAYQLRGMAVAAACRGAGVGAELLEAAVRALRERAERWLWCNARMTAVGFYAGRGFVADGEPYVQQPLGIEHVRMWRTLQPAATS